MAQDHFETPPDPAKGYARSKNPKESKIANLIFQQVNCAAGEHHAVSRLLKQPHFGKPFPATACSLCDTKHLAYGITRGG